jgi:O-antigen/teichoic acid export membrane protein
MNSIRSGTVWNLIGSLAPMLVGLLCIPYLIENIGVERFGVLTLVWSLIGYFSIFDFGIGRALTFNVSNLKSDINQENLQKSISSGMNLLLATGIIGGVILACISSKLGYSWLNTNQDLKEETFFSILLASLAIPFTTYTSGIKGVLEGYEDFKNINILKLILGILNFILPVISIIFFGKSLIFIVLFLVLTRFFILVLHLLQLNKKIKIKLILKKFNFKEKIDRKILNFGAWMTLSNVISPLMVNADRFLISYILGASVVAFYTIPFDLVIRLLIIPASITSVLFPRFSHLIFSNIKEATYLYNKSNVNIFKLMALITFLIIFFSFWGLKLWINEDVAINSYKILIILSFGVFFNSMAQVPYSLIQAAGRVKITSIIHMCEFVLYIFLLLILLKYFGILGAGIAFGIRALLDLILLRIIAKKILISNNV